MKNFNNIYKAYELIYAAQLNTEEKWYEQDVLCFADMLLREN